MRSCLPVALALLLVAATGSTAPAAPPDAPRSPRHDELSAERHDRTTRPLEVVAIGASAGLVAIWLRRRYRPTVVP